MRSDNVGYLVADLRRTVMLTDIWEKGCDGREDGEREIRSCGGRNGKKGEKRQKMCMCVRERERIYTSDRYPDVFINRNSIWAKQARQFWGNRIIPVLSGAHDIRCTVYTPASFTHQAVDLQRMRQRSRIIENSEKLHFARLYAAERNSFSHFQNSTCSLPREQSLQNLRFIKRDR